MKLCKKCNIKKDVDNFRKSGKYLRSECRQCEKITKRENRHKWREDPDKVKKRNQKYYEKNKSNIREQQADYYKNNSETIKNRAQTYYKENKGIIRLKHKLYYGTEDGFRKHSEKRILRKLRLSQATPKWADEERILEFYRACPQGFHVDHIVPINNDLVCGLHVAENLQYLTSTENTSKQNKFDFTLSNESWRESCNVLKRTHSPSELLQEYDIFIKNYRSYSASSSLNKITTHFNPHFYEIENKLWEIEEVRKKLVANREKYLNKSKFTDRELLRGFKVSGIHYGFSHHSPFWIKEFIKQFNISSIYDPCGGWGHRLLGSHDIKYIYNDIDARSVRGAMDMAYFLNISNKLFHCEDASEFTPKEDYEAVFTCPPYFNIETYTSPKTSTERFPDYSTWLSKFWGGLIDSSLKPGVKYFAYIMSPKYLDDMNKVCESRGLQEIFRTPVGKVNNSHLAKTAKDNRDILVVFDINKVIGV